MANEIEKLKNKGYFQDMHIKMDNLFKSLPRDLQWEVLTEFVGTHVVRCGKLMRKIVLTKINGKTFRLTGGNEVPVAVADLVRHRKQLPLVKPKYLRIYSNTDKEMQFFRDQNTDETVYLHRTYTNHMVLYEVRYLVTGEETDSAVLPPFNGTTYPSYPYTSKKRKIAAL